MTPEPLTVEQFAARCRERCSTPAQGHDGSVPCGGETVNDEGARVFSFCGRHWGPVLDAIGEP